MPVNGKRYKALRYLRNKYTELKEIEIMVTYANKKNKIPRNW
ncbi:hypothetical protein [Niabella hirudinis]